MQAREAVRHRSVIGSGRPRRSRPAGSIALAKDGRHDDEVAIARRGVGQHVLRIQGWTRHVVTKDVLQLDGLGSRGDVVRRDGGQDGVLIQDVIELPFQAPQFVVRQPQAGQMGDVFDIGARKGGHPPDDSGHMLSLPSRRPLLRPMTAADVAPVTSAILAADWGDRRAWFEFAVGHPGCDAVVAEVDGIVVGTGVTTRNGSVGWIGTIWVAAALRGQGLGRILTQATMDVAEAAGCRTLVLVATPSGQPLYERMGFRVRTWYRTMEAPGRMGDPRAADLAVDRRRGQIVRAFRTDDLPVMARLDAAATGEDRAHVLSAFASAASTRIVADPDDGARGFMIRAPWGGGATIAPDPDDAMALVDARRDAYPTDRKVRAGVLETNGIGIARLEADGWTEAWRAPRLEFGEPLEWDPAAIWGQFNHAIG